MNAKKGFTLIELLVVVAIIGILAAVAIPKLLAAIEKAKEGVMKSDMGALNSSMQMYMMNNPSNDFVVATSGTVSAQLTTHLCKTYMSQPPQAPWQASLSVTPYAYTYVGNGSEYTVEGYGYAKYEDKYTLRYVESTNIITKLK